MRSKEYTMINLKNFVKDFLLVLKCNALYVEKENRMLITLAKIEIKKISKYPLRLVNKIIAIR
jgi:hypothetical protein